MLFVCLTKVLPRNGKNVLQVNYMVHTEFLGENQGPNSFFQGLNFPTIRHKITRNAITNLCTKAISNFLLCKTMLFNRGYYIQGAFPNIQGLPWKNQGLFKDILQFFQFQGLFKAHSNQDKVWSRTQNKKSLWTTRKSDKITSKIEVTTVKSESAFGGGKRKTAK